MNDPLMSVPQPVRLARPWKIGVAMAMSFFCGCAMTALHQQGFTAATGIEMPAMAMPVAGVSVSGGGMMGTALPIVYLLSIFISAYFVHTWHKEIKDKGKGATIGVKSWLCICCCGCGGCLACCEPIDEV